MSKLTNIMYLPYKKIDTFHKCLICFEKLINRFHNLALCNSGRVGGSVFYPGSSFRFLQGGYRQISCKGGVTCIQIWLSIHIFVTERRQKRWQKRTQSSHFSKNFGEFVNKNAWKMLLSNIFPAQKSCSKKPFKISSNFSFLRYAEKSLVEHFILADCHKLSLNMWQGGDYV